MIRESVNSLKNIKYELYNVKKDTDGLSVDLKKLKEEHINKSNKRVKVRSILINIKVNRFNKRFNRFFNKPSSKTNACTIKDSTIVKNHVDVCTLIVKNRVDACTSTDDLIVKIQVDTSTSTDDFVVKNQVDTSTSTDDLVKNHADACTSTDDVCTNENGDDSDVKPGDNGNNDNKPGTMVIMIILRCK